MALRIRLTGRVGVEGDTGAFDGSALPGRQGRIVLAYLALNHHPVARDVLAELVWGETLPRSWERDLSAVVSKLKGLLARAGADGALGSAVGCYELRLPPDATVDVELARLYVEDGEQALRAGDLSAALAAASTAANLARRPFLPGDEGDWVQARRDELRELALQALDIAIACHRGRGEPMSAIRLATAAVELDPLRESGHATLMRLHLDAGNRAEALRTHERCRALLLDRLGVPPGPEVESVHREALLSDLVEGGAAPPLPPAVAAALTAGPLVGRAAQLHRLNEAWAQVRTGGRAVLLIAGEPGIGKTRLAAELAHAAQADGAVVLFGRCDPEPLAAYQPFVEALRRWVAEATPSEARAAAPHAAALGALLPELAARAGVSPGTPARDRLALYDAACSVLAAIGRQRPVALLLDDLHVADPSTAALLRHLARSARPARVLVLGTYRHAEPPPARPFAGLAAELRLDHLADEILLGGLDAEQTAALVEAQSGRRPDPGEAQALRDRTDGNPLFLSALAHAPADHGMATAPGVRDAIARHLARLPAPTVELLTSGAILGHELDLAVLARIVARERPALAAELEPALAARLLVEAPDGRLAFAHLLVRETLYESLGAVPRAELHAQAGAALESLRPQATQALAFHFLSARTDNAKAIRYAEAAAREAIAGLAFEQAIAILDQALELASSDDVELRRRLFTLRGTASAGLWHAVHDGERMRVVADPARQPAE